MVDYDELAAKLIAVDRAPNGGLVPAREKWSKAIAAALRQAYSDGAAAEMAAVLAIVEDRLAQARESWRQHRALKQEDAGRLAAARSRELGALEEALREREVPK